MALLKYTALRVALFLGVAVVLFVVGVHNLFADAMLAILVSGLISVVALKNVRNEVALKRQAADEAADAAEAAHSEAARAAAGDDASAQAPAPRPQVSRRRRSPLQRISDRIDAAARAEDDADDAERAALGEPLPPIPRPDLPNWEAHVPGAPSPAERPEQSR